jgi:protocatechuate 3,4-dioxygenase beta subunit
MSIPIDLRRRQIALTALAGAALAASPPVQAAARVATPRQPQGPFYPLDLPLDSDNDLVRVDGRGQTAEGEITHLFGTVRDDLGRPVADARIEIWQCDAHGRYRHPGDAGGQPIDPNFQGFGRTVTDGQGRYRFRTIKPVPYPGRAPHIHFAIAGAGFAPLVTQMYVAGAPENRSDFLLNRLTRPELRRMLMVEFRPSEDPSAELTAQFDIVVAADGG